MSPANGADVRPMPGYRTDLSNRSCRIPGRSCCFKGSRDVQRKWPQAAGLPRELVLYCARHDFGSFVLAKTGNLKAVMNAMGHGDVRSAMVYQHPEGEIIRNALNARHILRPTVLNDNLASA